MKNSEHPLTATEYIEESWQVILNAIDVATVNIRMPYIKKEWCTMELLEIIERKRKASDAWWSAVKIQSEQNESEKEVGNEVIDIQKFKEVYKKLEVEVKITIRKAKNNYYQNRIECIKHLMSFRQERTKEIE